jgi:hypothetical protein
MNRKWAGQRGGLSRNPNKGRKIGRPTRLEIAMRWHAGGVTQEELAREYGVGLSSVRRFCYEVDGGDDAPVLGEQDDGPAGGLG